MEDETLQGMLTEWTGKLYYERFLWNIQRSGIRFSIQKYCQVYNKSTITVGGRRVDAITSPHTPITSSYPVKISYWAKWFVVDFQHSIDLDCLGKLLKLIAENQENETIDWHPKVAVQR